jgi:cyanophycinase
MKPSLKNIVQTRIVFMIVATVLCATAFAAKPDEGAFEKEVIHAKGTLVVIGGAEIPRSIQDKIVSLVGGAGNAKVLVVPYATNEKERWLPVSDQEMLRKLGCKSVEMVTAAKDDMDAPETLAMLDGVNIVFFSGGSQSRLVNYLRGSKFLRKIRKIYDGGGVIAGTSAGASALCRVMTTGAENKHLYKPGLKGIDDRIETGRVDTVEGFGYFQNIIIAQHFMIRKRTNHLVSAVMDNPTLRGIGIDESTAIVVSPDSSLEVIGRSKVMIIEPMQERKEWEPLTTFKVILLSNGDKYKL